MTNVKMGLAGLKPADLLAKAGKIVGEMDGNALFPNPTPSMADLTAEVDALREWINKAAFGDRRAIEQRKVHVEALIRMLRQLALYVGMVANGDPNIILAAGFEVRRRIEGAAPMGIPINLRAMRSDYAGKVLVQWGAVSRARSYLVEMCSTDPSQAGASWTIVGSTTRSRSEVSNLQAGQYYWFRVRAIGASAESPYSDVALVMAA